MADDTKASGSKGLPSLPKKRSGPFDRLAGLAESVEPPADLREQAERDAATREVAPSPVTSKPPAIATGKRRGRPAIPTDEEQIFLQTTLPLSMFQAFKMHCIEHRTTVREELRRLVAEMLERKRRAG